MTEANLQGRVRSLLQTGLARSVGSLYLVQFVSYMLPLITLPWLARVLGPSGLGILATTLDRLERADDPELDARVASFRSPLGPGKVSFSGSWSCLQRPQRGGRRETEET